MEHNFQTSRSSLRKYFFLNLECFKNEFFQLNIYHEKKCIYRNQGRTKKFFKLGGQLSQKIL